MCSSTSPTCGVSASGRWARWPVHGRPELQAMNWPSGLTVGRHPGIFRSTIRLPCASMSRIAWPNPIPPCTVEMIHLPLGAKRGLIEMSQFGAVGVVLGRAAVQVIVDHALRVEVDHVKLGILLRQIGDDLAVRRQNGSRAWSAIFRRFFPWMSMTHRLRTASRPSPTSIV